MILTNVENLPKPGYNFLQQHWEPEWESQRAIEPERDREGASKRQLEPEGTRVS